MLERLVLRLTHRLWNRQISRILCRAKEDGVISGAQMHDLASAFDPTQLHIVYGYRVPHGFNGPRGVLSAVPKLMKAHDLPIPSGVYWSPSGGNFYSYDTKRGMGDEFYAAWNGRRHEFPQWDSVGQR